MIESQNATLNCDLFIAIGSSLQVYPAAGFPILAKRNGSKLIILNREPTDLDGYADLILNYEIGIFCLLYTSPSPRDKRQSRMPSSA